MIKAYSLFSFLFACICCSAQQKNILTAFYSVDASVQKSAENVDTKTTAVLKELQGLGESNPYYYKSVFVDETAKEFIAYVDTLKNTVSQLSENANDMLAPELFVTRGKGKELKNKINTTRLKLLSYLAPDEQLKIKSDLIAADDREQTWESELFVHTPAAAAITILEKFKNDAKNTELQILNLLLNSLQKPAGGGETLKAIVLPQSQYVLAGSNYQADILLVKHDSLAKFSAYVSGSESKSENGVIKYQAIASTPGVYLLSGYVDNGKQKIPFESEYSVFIAKAVISADAMNVFYVGLDNPVSVAVPGFSPDNVMVSIAGGSLIKRDANNYVAKFAQRGEAMISVSVRMGDGSMRAMGTAKFRVRNVPPPVAQLGTLQNDDEATVEVIKANASRLLASLGDGFVFDGVKFTVTSFTFKVQKTNGEGTQPLHATDSILTNEMLTQIDALQPGDRITIDNIKAMGSAGEKLLAPIVITAK